MVGRCAGPARTVRLERVEDGEVIEWRAPPNSDRVSADAEWIVVCVRYEQLDTVAERVRDCRAPVVFLTPMMPADHARLSAALPGRVVVGMPSVVAYQNEAGAIRHWLPRVAATLIEDRTDAGAHAAEAQLVRALSRAGIEARLDAHVLARNVATTITFVPVMMALDVAGSVDAALADSALVSLALAAAAEGRRLARIVGKPAPWASAVARFMSPRTLSMGVGVAKRRAPEAVAYAERHFGRKLHAQNVAMAEAMVKLAKEKNVACAAMEGLLERLREDAAP